MKTEESRGFRAYAAALIEKAEKLEREAGNEWVPIKGDLVKLKGWPISMNAEMFTGVDSETVWEVSYVDPDQPYPNKRILLRPSDATLNGHNRSDFIVTPRSNLIAQCDWDDV